MPVDQPVPGQRWVSDSEPELGLGIILKAASGRVEIFFPAADEHRQYALESAPIRRVRFSEGERLKLHDLTELLVTGVEERAGLLIYQTAQREVREVELSDLISFSKPEDRLLAGQIDELALFDLRVEALFWRGRMRQSAARGFAGGRVELIPHQIYIAGEVARRLLPRVLLADEVGLGKTIEAGLILHRLHLTGRAQRVLILVPEPLINQWFVEMLRRFNLLFSLFDEERCQSIEQHNPDANPFLDSQLVICSLAFFAPETRRWHQVLAAHWDLLVVDEAHHLAWPSPAYAQVEALAQQTPGLLLLTATPQQLGLEGHFARLRLLDPDRYVELGQFLKEAERYEQVARTIDRLLAGEAWTKEDAALLGTNPDRQPGDEAARHRLVARLLDEFGTGRVMFRNTRAALSGFPKREARLVTLPTPAKGDFTLAKVKWLARLLKELGDEKVLLICHSRELAEEIFARLQHEVKIAAGLFHEGLTLLQRDRHAAFFAEPEGARILICSEIGSEGRNFQFAHHLVLFDLPDDPELLEQRIGRLDRIGQAATIKIHVPYFRGTDSEVLARWYHEGLHAFEKNLHGASEIARLLQRELAGVREKPSPTRLQTLLARSVEVRRQIAAKLAHGHDRLLELNSCKTAEAETLIRQIAALDADEKFESFFLRLLDHFGVQVEELSRRTYLLQPGHLFKDALPGLPAEGLSATFDRTRALSREDFGFLTVDHPLVRGTLDLLLGSEAGNTAFGIWKAPGSEAIWLEIFFIVECLAPAAWQADRFFPPTPIRIVVDHTLVDHTASASLKNPRLEKGDVFRLLDRGAVKKKLLPAMLERAQAIAAEKMRDFIASATAAMATQLHHESERLENLRARNDHVRPQEIVALREQERALREAIAAARLRTEALRLIFRIP